MDRGRGSARCTLTVTLAGITVTENVKAVQAPHSGSETRTFRLEFVVNAMEDDDVGELEVIVASAGRPPTAPIAIGPALGTVPVVTGERDTRAPARGAWVPALSTTPSTEPLTPLRSWHDLKEKKQHDSDERPFHG